MHERPSNDSLSSRPPHALLLTGCVGLLALISVFLIGLGAGFGFGRLAVQPGMAAVPAWFASAHPEPETGPGAARLDPEFDLFWEAMNLLYRDFYGELPADSIATYGAIRGVVGLLEDPNTSFLTPEEAEFFRSTMEGSFEGIGARVDWDDEADTARVVEPFANQPAARAGIRRGDLILAVDGESIVGSDLTEAVRRIRGPQGSIVVLTLRREGEAEPFDVEVRRDRIEMPAIVADTVGDDESIGYIQLNTFTEDAGRQARSAVEAALARSPRGLILDLRGNTGGLLREAVKVTSLFLEDEVVLIERFNDGKEEVYRTEGRAPATEVPLVVLVDGASASASEIVAGALQDAGRAQLVGETTFGKGSVQLPHPLSDGSILRVTIARWYTPKNRSIDGLGLTPDEIVERTDEQRDADVDPQLDAAIALLEGIE